ncbi:MAG: type I methionyl aminopeptidase [Candidatus Babeliales bacterium]
MSSIIIKNKLAIDRMRTAGYLLADVIEEIRDSVIVGATTRQIDATIEKSMLCKGLKAECKGYGGYKFATCISLNDIIVHGVPSQEVVLKNGDFVKIDVVGSYKGYCADMTRFFFVGNVSDQVKRIANTAQNALNLGIEIIQPGVKLSAVSARIQHHVEQAGYAVVRDFAGHGIGRCMHEEPDVPNYEKDDCDVILREGMTLAIEPMIAEYGFQVTILEDGWTAKTADGGLAAHVEDTIVVTRDGVEILTRKSVDGQK